MSSGNRSSSSLKILCVADHVDPLVYSTRAHERFSEIDLVLSAGDLQMKYLGFIASSLNKPVVFVFGNHNLEELERFERRLMPPSEADHPSFSSAHRYGSTYADGKVVRVDGLLIAGLGGSMRYNNGAHQFTEFQMAMRMVRLIPRLLWNRIVHGRYVDILLTHAAPRGIHDRTDKCHIGFKSFRWFMRRFKPRYLLHGHIHLYDPNEPRVTRYFQTDVINVYDHYVLEYNDTL